MTATPSSLRWQFRKYGINREPCEVHPWALATWFHCSYDVNGAPHVVTRACFTCYRKATAA